MKSFKETSKLKRIAIATVSALTFGLLSSVPAHSAFGADTLTIDATTDAIIAGETATAVITQTFIATAAGDSLSVTAIAGDAVTLSPLPVFAVSETTNVIVTGAGTSKAYAGVTSSNVFASVKYNLNLVTSATATPGTYKFFVFAGTGAGTGTVAAPTLTWTVTVTAPDTKAGATYSTSILNSGETVSATTDATVFAPKAVSSDAAAVIVVNQKTAANAAAAESMTVILSGTGMLGHGSNYATMSASARALVVPAGNYIGVFADGTAGTGTITIMSASGVTLGTEKVTFYGDIAKIVNTVKKSVLTTGANTEALTSVAYDANDVVVGNGTLYVSSDSAAVVSESMTAVTIVNGVASVPLTGVKKGPANIKVSSGTISATSAVRVEGTATTVKIAFDKKQYIPGEVAKITVSVFDEDGKTLSPKTFANLFATGGITSSYSFSAGSDNVAVTSITTDTETTKVFTVYMPITEAKVEIKATGGSSLATAGQVVVTDSATVFDANAQATRDAVSDATDAAQAATEAANAATSAAQIAAESADAATAAAEAAKQAVDDLAAQVAELFTALQKQITTLAAVVAKIAKKVKA